MLYLIYGISGYIRRKSAKAARQIHDLCHSIVTSNCYAALVWSIAQRWRFPDLLPTRLAFDFGSKDAPSKDGGLPVSTQ